MSDFYKYTVIATEGNQGIQDLGNRTSINDAGTVALTGDLDTSVFGGNAVFVGDGFSLTNIAPASVLPNQRFGTSVQINNAGQVIAGFRRTTGTSAIRLFDSNSTDSFQTIATGGSSLPNSIPGFDFFATFIASINNSGESVFTAIDKSFTNDLLVTPNERPLNQNEPPFNELVLPSTVRLSALRPMIADTGDVVVKINDEILLYDFELSEGFLGFGGPETIASSSDFTTLGQSPGISDDGKVVAFYGEDNNGSGIFAWVKGPTFGSDQVVRVASINNEITGFDPNSRIGVSTDFITESITPNLAYTRGQATISYIAYDTNGNESLYTSRIRSEPDDGIIIKPEVSVSSNHTLVARVGDTIPRLGTIQDLNIYDPVNKDGQVAFWAKTDTNQETVIRAEAPYSLVYRTMKLFAQDSSWSNLTSLNSPIQYTGSVVPGIDHVALKANNLVYESHPGYEYAQAWDSNAEAFIPIQKINGVQQTHTIGSFKFNSSISTLEAVEEFLEVPISVELGERMENIIKDLIQQGLQGGGEPNIGKGVEYPAPIALEPLAQKGFIPNFAGIKGITCVGLTEYASELAGHNGGQGFVPNAWETINVLGIDIPTLSPSLQYYAATHPNTNNLSNSDILQIAIDPVDFILTDPQGRKLGFANGQSFNEIPDAMYTGDGGFEQVAIIDPLVGDYTLELFGLGENAFAAIDSLTSEGASFSGFLGQGETKTISIDVTGNFDQNNLPTAQNDTVTTAQATPVTIAVLSNDIDSDGDTLNIDNFDTISTQGGTVTLDDNNTPSNSSDDQLIYTPLSGFTGTDTFIYTVSDGTEAANATVEVTVNPLVNTPPQPINDSTTINEDTTVEIDVLANDTDAENNPLTLSINEAPSNGTATVNDNRTPDTSDDTITYTPNSNFNGTDSFTYNVSDGTDTTSATVDIAVNPVNDIPVAVNDTVQTNQDQPLTILDNDLLSNDSDVDGDDLTIAEVSNSANGTVELDADGNVLFTPDTNFNGLASFEYTVSDGSETAQATVEVTVNPVNDLPVAVNDTAQTNEDQPLTILASDLLSNDSDVDGDELTITAVDNSANGTVELDANGNVLFTPDTNFNGIASFEYTVSDGTETAQANVEVTVNPVNDLPVAVNDTAQTNEDQPLTILASDLLSNDSDVDGDELTITEASNSTDGTVELDADGNVLFTPDSDFNGLASFDYTVTDGSETAQATVEVTVNPVNDDNIINGTTGRDSLLGTDSNDIITGFQGSDIITTGAGEDQIIYNSIVDAGDLITDFNPMNDTINLQGVLESIGFSGDDAIADGYLKLVSYGSRGTSLQIDADGTDGSAIFRPYLFLQGVFAAQVNDNPDSLMFS